MNCEDCKNFFMRVSGSLPDETFDCLIYNGEPYVYDNIISCTHYVDKRENDYQKACKKNPLYKITP